MDTVFLIILILHASAGFGALILGAINAVMPKGGARHRTVGSYYIGCMVGVGFTALGLATLHPNIFLAMVGLFSLHLAWAGYRAVRIHTHGHVDAMDWATSSVALTAGCVLVTLGAMHANIVMVVFGTISAVNALTDFRFFRRLQSGRVTKGAWLRRHVGLVGGSYIAVWTAFLVVNVHVDPSILCWLLPTAIGTPIIAYATRKHMMRFALLFLCSITIGQAAVDHSLFTKILKQHVKNGVVSYSTLKTDARLDTYLTALSKEDASELRGNDRKAFWVNLYNAIALKTVCEAYPIKSIQDIADVWTKKRITVDGESYSLNDVENMVIRPMADARTHFALVCAAKSCPPLRSEAYLPKTIDAQLDDQGRTFFRSTKWNTFDVVAGTAKLSKIIDWYMGDFGGMYTKMLKYVSAFTTDDVRSALTGSGYSFTVSFVDYDWSLNDH